MPNHALHKTRGRAPRACELCVMQLETVVNVASDEGGKGLLQSNANEKASTGMVAKRRSLFGFVCGDLGA